MRAVPRTSFVADHDKDKDQRWTGREGAVEVVSPSDQLFDPQRVFKQALYSIQDLQCA